MNILTIPQIAIVDDDEQFSRNLKKYIEMYGEKEHVNIHTECFKSGVDFVEGYTAKYDIIFLDIEMPHLNGIEVASEIRQSDDSVCIIFVTNAMQYAICGYSVNAMDYLVKPVDYGFFEEKLRKALRLCEKSKDMTFILRTANGIVKLNYLDVPYIESQKHYLFYHTVETSYKVRGMIREIEEDFLAHSFVACNASCLVNLAHVQATDKVTVTVADVKIPISRLLREEFLSKLTKYLGGSV